jgi:hypothetical protein
MNPTSLVPFILLLIVGRYNNSNSNPTAVRAYLSLHRLIYRRIVEFLSKNHTHFLKIPAYLQNVTVHWDRAAMYRSLNH